MTSTSAVQPESHSLAFNTLSFAVRQASNKGSLVREIWDGITLPQPGQSSLMRVRELTPIIQKLKAKDVTVSDAEILKGYLVMQRQFQVMEDLVKSSPQLEKVFGKHLRIAAISQDVQKVTELVKPTEEHTPLAENTSYIEKHLNPLKDNPEKLIGIAASIYFLLTLPRPEASGVQKWMDQKDPSYQLRYLSPNGEAPPKNWLESTSVMGSKIKEAYGFIQEIDGLAKELNLDVQEVSKIAIEAYKANTEVIRAVSPAQ